MIEFLSFASTLLKSKNKTNKLKNDKILTKSIVIIAIIIKKFVTILINILIKSQIRSFHFGNLFVKNSSQYKNYF